MNTLLKSAAVLTCLLLFAGGMSLSAQPQAPAAAQGPYDLSKLKGICGYVYDRTRAPAGSGSRFVYQQRMAEAAGVTASDDAATKKAKVQMLWRDNQSVFTCTASNFNMANGNLLKYSVRSRSYNFLGDAIDEEWQLEMNFIDPVDHRTILDYLEQERAANAGNSDESGLKNLYDDAKHYGGAKHCYDLINPAFCMNPSPSSFPGTADFREYINFNITANENARRAVAGYNERLRTSGR